LNSLGSDLEFKPMVFVKLFFIGSLRAYLDVQKQMDGTVKNTLQFLAGSNPNMLDLSSFSSQDDGFLALTLYVDHLGNFKAAISKLCPLSGFNI